MSNGTLQGVRDKLNAFMGSESMAPKPADDQLRFHEQRDNYVLQPPQANTRRDKRPSGNDTRNMVDISREEIDAKLEATNAKVDARLSSFESTVRETLAAVRQDSSEVKGELKAIHVELSYLKGLKANIWGATAITIGLLGAMLAYGVASFDSGRDTAQLVETAKQQTAATQKLLEQIQAQQKQLEPTSVPLPPSQSKSPQ